MIRETYKIHHFICSVGKTLSITLTHGLIGEVRGEDGHQTILVAMIEQVQEWTYQIAVLAVFQRFQSYIIDGKDANITEIAVLVFLLLKHRSEFVGIHHLQTGFGWIAVIVKIGRIGKVREVDKQLESTDGGCLAIAWSSSKNESKRSIRITDPSADTSNAFLYGFFLLVVSSPVLNGCLVELQKNLVRILNEEPSSASRRLLAEHQAR